MSVVMRGYTANTSRVRACHIVDGRVPHAVMLEIFTDHREFGFQYKHPRL